VKLFQEWYIFFSLQSNFPLFFFKGNRHLFVLLLESWIKKVLVLHHFCFFVFLEI
jgi:hypothetical protein